MEEVRVIVAGGRDFNDSEYAFKSISHALSKIDRHVLKIVEGGATGADALGRKWAEINTIPYVTFEADWSSVDKEDAIVRKRKDGVLYNAKAGFDRNEQMAKYSTHLIAFWDGNSRGTKGMIHLAKKEGLKMRIFKY